MPISMSGCFVLKRADASCRLGSTCADDLFVHKILIQADIGSSVANGIHEVESYKFVSKVSEMLDLERRTGMRDACYDN
jgi:hypothetical protein